MYQDVIVIKCLMFKLSTVCGTLNKLVVLNRNHTMK